MRDESELREEFKKIRLRISEGQTDINVWRALMQSAVVLAWALGAPNVEAPSDLKGDVHVGEDDHRPE
jgi:hypothetical protein